MNYLNFNGELLDASQPALGAGNRSFLYGDGLFETIRFANGKLLFANDHIERLKAGATTLAMEFPNELTVDYLQKASNELAEKNGYSNARLRLTLFREGDGRYTPESNKASWVLTISAIEGSDYKLNENGLNIGIYDAEKKSIGVLANHKTTSALLYVIASQYRLQQGWDDALILNTQGRMIEATSSNIFLVKGTYLHTPSLSEGCVAGVMRKNILKWAAEAGFGVSSGQVTKDMLLDADELLLTNVITGIRWVGKFGAKIYEHKVAGRLMEIMNSNVV